MNQNPNFNLRQRPVWSARELSTEPTEFIQGMLDRAGPLLSEEFKGVTADGTIEPGLFPLANTGESTARLIAAADGFLASLKPEQKAKASFPVDAEEWRRWSNIHPFLMRHGVLLDDLTSSQRESALRLVKESLSPGGFETLRNSMKLNASVGELLGSVEEYGEWLYWLSIFGTPSSGSPWGWQFDGHHLIINCFVLGEQVVMTPMFMGSEPIVAQTGKYAGTTAYRSEALDGLKLAQTLTKDQRSKAILGEDLPPDVFTSAYRDNFELRYEGVRFDELSNDQQSLLLGLTGTYLNRMSPGHAQVKFSEVREHLGETYFSWIGGTSDESVFYYRIHSPVVLIEFDHNRGIAFDNDEPSQNHIHTVIRTPNGNDYGKDLLGQHRAQVTHT